MTALRGLIVICAALVGAAACADDDQADPTRTVQFSIELETADRESAVSVPGVDEPFETSGGLIEFEADPNDEGGSAAQALASHVSTDLAVRDLRVRPLGIWVGYGIERDGEFVAYRLSAPRTGGQSPLALEGYSLAVGVVTITSPATSFEDEHGITHRKAEPVRVRGGEGYLLDRESSGAVAYAVCDLIWLEDDMLWRLSSRCDASETGMTTAEIIERAENDLVEFDRATGRFEIPSRQ